MNSNLGAQISKLKLRVGLLELWMRLREELLKRKKLSKKIGGRKITQKNKYINEFSKIC